MTPRDLTVVDDTESSRFHLLLDGAVVGRADYAIHDDVVTVPHVETDPRYRGNGFAAVLMGAIVDSLRTNGQTIRPVCSYAAAYLRERPDTHDLVAI